MKDSFLRILQREGRKAYFEKLLEKLKIEGEIKSIVPHQLDLFRPLEFFQVEQTKVIILGQDPYPGYQFADGLAFSTRNKKTPVSLQNMFKELKKDYPNVELKTNDLSAWAKQGVLLINTVWTTNLGQPNAHKKWGWEEFTYAIVSEVLQANKNVICVALGNQAKKFFEQFNIPVANLIELSHPSHLGYRFSFKDGHMFKLINEKLKALNESEINWNLPAKEE